MGPDAAVNAVKKSLQMGATEGCTSATPRWQVPTPGPPPWCWPPPSKDAGRLRPRAHRHGLHRRRDLAGPGAAGRTPGPGAADQPLRRWSWQPDSNTVTAVREAEDGAPDPGGASCRCWSPSPTRPTSRATRTSGDPGRQEEEDHHPLAWRAGPGRAARWAPPGPRPACLTSAPRPAARRRGTIITDSGDAGIALVDFLADAKLI